MDGKTKDGRYLSVRAHVSFRDGSGGSLHRVVLNPHTNQITDLVVVRGLVARHEHVVPVSAVKWLARERLDISLFTDEWAHQPEYREVEHVERLDDWENETLFPRRRVLIWYPLLGIYERQSTPPPARHCRVAEGIPANEVVIGHSARVNDASGHIGRVDYLLLKPESWEVTHLVVQHGLMPHHIVVPMSWVREITLDEIYIQENDRHLGKLPESHGSRVDTAASFWDTKSEVTQLDMNLTVADEIARALTEDERTASSVIEVVYDRGVVTLAGTVATEQAHQAAEEIAHRHAGVLSVVNALEVQAVPFIVDKLEDVFGQAIAHACGTDGRFFQGSRSQRK